MFVEQIIINNFRVYKGENVLNFATSNEQNITLIAGNNGFGKTSFLTSLVWGLYGKLMVDVDERYKQEVNESGGYARYCEKLMNRLAFTEGEIAAMGLRAQLDESLAYEHKTIKSGLDKMQSFSVKLSFSNIMIPSVPCKKLEIERVYNVFSHKETLTILIDGRENELTKTVGPEIFINDFILPKEIAKFFFFDAEKIVFLADINTAEEKRYLSQAYAEVLGIKRYTDLKESLSQMRLRIRTKSANKSDRNALDKLNKQFERAQELEKLKQNKFSATEEELQFKRVESDKYQEQLIRVGSTVTVEELKRLREKKNALSEELAKIRLRFNDMLELAPLAMVAHKMADIKHQLERESSSSPAATALLQTKLSAIVNLLEPRLQGLSIEQQGAILEAVKEEMLPNSTEEVRMLLGFAQEQQERFYRAYEMITTSFGKNFKNLLNEQKRLQTLSNSINKQLQDGEAKGKDPVIAQIRAEKDTLDIRILELEKTRDQLDNDLRLLTNEKNSLLRQISELSKKVNLEDVDKEKDAIAKRLSEKLDIFIQRLKTKKKTSLERNIKFELNRLMHKSDFVASVEVIIDGDLIDIDLYDGQNKYIHKELLSKGEQQLYATALLKALVDESNVRFPVFIDSPLQKFDRNHSQNIIKEFYPNLSAQVVLFPLLEKELNSEEYNLMQEQIGKAFLIKQSEQFNSGFEEVEPQLLFTWHKQALLNYVQ